MAIKVAARNTNALVVNQGVRSESAVVVGGINATAGTGNARTFTSRTNSLVVGSGSRSESAVVIKRLEDSLTVQGLSNVDSTNLQDGYTIIYDEATNTWIAQEVVATAVAGIDGGSY